MSRSGYDEDAADDNWALIRWRGAVASAIRGKRGQAFLRELRDALDAMPEKRLIEAEFVTRAGDVCALGAVGRQRGIDLAGLDPDNTPRVALIFGISEALVREIVFENDEVGWLKDTPEARWRRVRNWVERQVEQKTVEQP